MTRDELEAFVRGLNPLMNRDINVIIERMHEIDPATNVEQLKVKFAADDDGLWFFKHPNSPFEVQLGSSDGKCPFLIETDEHNERFYAHTVDEAVDILKRWFRLRV